MLPSFESDHFLVRTNSFILRIQKTGLDPGVSKRLDTPGKRVDLAIPSSSIDMAWKVAKSDDELPRYIAVDKKGAFGKEGLRTVGSDVFISGEMIPSLESSYTIFKAGDLLVRVRNGGALKGQMKAMADNHSVAIQVPKSDVDFIWQTATQTKDATRMPSSTTVEDGVRVIGEQVEIQGRVLHSFQEPHVLIQASNEIYQIRKSALSGHQLAELRTGERCSVVIPSGSIIMQWSVRDDAK